jgi:hypothetical protein
MKPSRIFTEIRPVKTVTLPYRWISWVNLQRYGLSRKRVAVTGRLRVIYGCATIRAISSEITMPTMPGGCRDALPLQRTRQALAAVYMRFLILSHPPSRSPCAACGLSVRTVPSTFTVPDGADHLDCCARKPLIHTSPVFTHRQTNRAWPQCPSHPSLLPRAPAGCREFYRKTHSPCRALCGVALQLVTKPKPAWALRVRAEVTVDRRWRRQIGYFYNHEEALREYGECIFVHPVSFPSYNPQAVPPSLSIEKKYSFLCILFLVGLRLSSFASKWRFSDYQPMTSPSPPTNQAPAPASLCSMKHSRLNLLLPPVLCVRTTGNQYANSNGWAEEFD